MQTKFRQCVCCGFNALRGSVHEFIPSGGGGKKFKSVFVCSACEMENIEEDERRYLDEEDNEVERLGKRAVERF